MNEYVGYVPPLSESEQKRELALVTKTYETEIGPVELKSVTLFPSEDIKDADVDPRKGILFLGGYGGSPDMESSTWLSQAYADKSKGVVHSISTRTERTNQPDSLFHQAYAVAQYAKEKGLESIKVVGVSEGGAKGMDLVSILKKYYPEITVEAIFLNNSVGLYDQSRTELISNFALDGLISPKSISSAKTAGDAMKGFGEEIAKSGKTVFSRAIDDMKEMATLRETAKDIECPVYVILGENDLVANPDKVTPNYDKQVDFNTRSKDLQGRVFTNSPHVEVMIAKKSGHHGAPFERTEAYAGVPLFRHEKYLKSMQGE